jgi:hypothetical protein
MDEFELESIKNLEQNNNETRRFSQNPLSKFSTIIRNDDKYVGWFKNAVDHVIPINEVPIKKINKLREYYRSRRVVHKKPILLLKSNFKGRISSFFSVIRGYRHIENYSAFLFFELVADLMICILAVVEMFTSAPNTSTNSFEILRPFWMYCTLMVLAFYNMGLFLIRILFAEHVTNVVISWTGLIDYITTFPFLFTLIPGISRNLFIPYFLRCWTIVERLRSLLFVFDNYLDQLTIKLHVLVYSCVSFLFTGMMLFFWTELV